MGRDSPSTSRKGAKRQRIDADDCASLHDFFAVKDWALNTNLLRGNVYDNSKVGMLSADLGLFSDRMSR